MAVFKTSNISTIAANVYWNPTQVSPSVVGTQLGATENIAVSYGHQVIKFPNKMAGDNQTILRTMRSIRVLMLQRDFDPDMLPLIFENVDTNTASGYPAVKGNYRDAQAFLESGNKLYVAAKEPEKYNSVLLYNAIAYIPEESEIDFQIDKKFGIPVVFEGLPEPTGEERVYFWGKAQDAPL